MSPDTYLPLFFKTEGLACLTVGAGEVARRKVEMLAELGCRITIVALEIDPAIRAIAERGGAVWRRRAYASGDCVGFQLVIAATQHREVNRRVYEEARSLGIPVNVVDDPELCTVVFPALWRDGPLTVAVSTGGTAPFMASAVRDSLARGTRGWGTWVAAAGRFRDAVRKSVADDEAKNRLYRRFMQKALAGTASSLPESAELQAWIEWLDS
jgi:uroporphyrin-III C-methyltransferase/precorrin-2 dehydrogenase/sirohydrochlorin ferrochelatase